MYVDHFYDISVELKKLGDEIEEQNIDNLPEANAAQNKIKAVPVKHGYSSFEEFSLKVASITRIFGVLKYEEEVSKLDPAYQGAAKQALEMQKASIIPEHGEGSLEAVKKRYSDIDKLMKKIDDSDL